MGQSASSSSSPSGFASDRFTPVFEEVEQLLEKLEESQTDSSNMLSTLKGSLEAFKVEFKFLKMFLDMAEMLNHVVWCEPESPLPRIEAGIYEIAEGFMIKKVSKLLEKIEVLKPFIEESCDSLRMNPHFLEFKHHHPSWDDYDHWDELLNSVGENLQILSEKADLQIDSLPLQGQLKAFLQKLSSLTDFLVNVSSSGTHESDLKALRIHAGTVAIRAANLSCLCWLRGTKMDPSMAEEMGIAFSQLQHKIDPANPEFLGMIIRFLSTIRYNADFIFPMNMFIHHLLHLKRKRTYALYSELADLIKSFVDVRDAHNKLLPDMAAVFGKAGSLEDLLSSEGGGPADLLPFKLVAMIRLLRAEIFVIELLNHRGFSTETTLDFVFWDAPSLAKAVREQVGGIHLHSKSARHKYAYPLEENMEFWEELYKLSQQVAKELKPLQNSLDAGEITRSAIRRPLFKWLTRISVFKAVAYLMDLLNNNASLVLLVKDQVGTLKSLVESITNMPRKLIFLELEKFTEEDETLIMKHIESVARQVLSLSHSFHAAEFTGGMIKELSDQLSGLIEKTKQVIDEIDVQFPHIEFPKTNGLGFIDFLLIKLRELLKYKTGSIAFAKRHKRELLKYESDLIAFVKQHIEVILGNLGFLRSFLLEQNFKHQELKELGICLRDAAYQAELIIDSIVLGHGSERKNLSYLYHVSENIRHIKMQVMEFEEEAFNGGVRNSILTVGPEIAQTSTCEIIEDVVLNDQQQVIVDRVTRGMLQRGMWHEISHASSFEINEDVVVLNDQQQVTVNRLTSGPSQRDIWLKISQARTSGINEDVMVLNEQQQVIVDELTGGLPQRDVGHKISKTSTFKINDDVVVLNDQKQVIVDRLTRGSSQRDVVSIIGMPGIGKTTLANKVYHDPEVVYYFHIRAWCCVSQVYTKRDLLFEILRHVVEITDSILMMTNEDLEFVLYKHLKRRRYLIFMDDVWNIGAWDDLKSSFPDDGNGSRILITSRLHDVVSKVTLESDLLNIRPLSDDESWELLKMKIFSKECCPDELLEVGKEIARNCKGLPLSIVAIAGLLQGTHMKPDSWKQIAESLNSILVIDPQTRCMDILELSYKHLPDYLKACFLYFGAFQEDKEIPVRRLLWLWMAEGFILTGDSKSLEDLAEDYLRDLIGRSLITVAKRRSNGGVKTCRMHDMVRNLCLLKAKEENFLELVTSNDEPYASFDDSVDFDDFDPSNSMMYKEHRLCISVSRRHFVMSRPSGPYVRSMLFFATTDAYPRCPYNISFVSENFKLLKVLDLESINMGSSFEHGIAMLVQLSYLAVGGDIDSIPLSLANLRNLETLLVKGLKGKVILPDSIWHMSRLRHVHVSNHAVFTLQNKSTGSYYELSNLVSLSLVSLSSGEHAEVIIRRLPNLQKLCCIFSRPRDYSTNCNPFPRLEGLTQLESLKIVYRGRTIYTSEFNFPLSLKKLTLSNFFLRWDHISTIGRLENLEVLKLVALTFEDTRWEMVDGEFPELKFLKLDSLNIVEWNAFSHHLPNLQQLVLCKCKNLKEVPSDFMDIPTLQLIEVQLCGESLEESVRRLKEEQLGYGIEDLKVLINH